MVCMATFGMGMAIMNVMDALLIVRLLGVRKFQSAFGISQLFRCVAFIVLGQAGECRFASSRHNVATLVQLLNCFACSFSV